jgi:hypothetical protein
MRLKANIRRSREAEAFVGSRRRQHAYREVVSASPTPTGPATLAPPGHNACEGSTRRATALDSPGLDYGMALADDDERGQGDARTEPF